MTNSLSCGPFSESNSSAYDIPEQPPPFTPMRRKTSSPRFCSCFSRFTCWIAVSESISAIALSSLLRGRPGLCLSAVLVLVVRQRGLDRVLGEYRAVDLDRRQLQLVHDVRVLDLRGLVDGLALEPLRGEAR